MRNYKNCIYILTNAMCAGYVKIGYTSDLQKQLSDLNTGMLKNFTVYAVYETPTKSADKQFHALIDDLAPIVRVRVVDEQENDFFKLEPEQAYNLFEHIAIMSGTENRLHRYDESEIESEIVENHVADTPVKYQIGSSIYEFDSWKNSLVRHCEHIIEVHGFQTFKQKALDIKVSTKASKRKTFAETEREMRGFSYYKFTQGDLYLLTNYSAEYIRKINARLNELFPDVCIQYE